MTTSMRWADENDPVAGRMIFVSATAGIRDQDTLVSAWNLYQGGCLPQLRKRLDGHPQHRSRVRLVSAEYGLLHPDTSVPPPSIREMTEELAGQLRPQARTMLLEEFGRYGLPREVMLLVEFPYHHVVKDIFRLPGMTPRTSLGIPHPAEHWTLIAAVLDRWGWP
ncbi:hypothetical protein [Actinoplanes derwentensis]|uniref:Uncharacterized protein n=1 Tax=Actinoplanes derwentensis TaxID=113562 RepID=A0A1H2CVE4_9ACTN|nr:hypothetical protein [Actinoplanes derwentensis]SDT74498.1 hypothetical protein SAMN04489716_7000 [Actinoplanes derwentensis]